MATVVGPSRNPIVRDAFEALHKDERRMARIKKAYQTKPLEQLPAAKSKPAKPAKAKKGKR